MGLREKENIMPLYIPCGTKRAMVFPAKQHTQVGHRKKEETMHKRMTLQKELPGKVKAM